MKRTTSAVPSGLRRSIERQTGCDIVAEVPRGGGGASRHGAELSLRDDGGRQCRCYLSWDSRDKTERMPSFLRETAILRALAGPLADAGVRVAPLLATDENYQATCSLFVEGQERFPSSAEQAHVARDFVDQLARLHALDAAHPALAALGNAHERPASVIHRRLDQLSDVSLASGADPILQLALQWIRANVPEDCGPSTVLHGDAGPGNFLFRDRQVVALVDWEFAHLGDPMEDLAQVWVRSLIQPFVPMTEVFTWYEQASGTRVDVARAKYHRLYFQLGFMVKSGGQPATGTAMLYGAMHRRIIVESLAELTATPLPTVELPECAIPQADEQFAVALDDLKQEIVPAIVNERAAAKAKAMARMIKFWRQRERYGALFDASELAEIAAALGKEFKNLSVARTALGRAIAAGEVRFGEALHLCHARTARETTLMADAVGALATTRYEDSA